MKPTENNNSAIFNPNAKEIIIHVKDDRYGCENKVARITPEQQKFLNWLEDNGYINEEIAIEYGYPEVEDLTK